MRLVVAVAVAAVAHPDHLRFHMRRQLDDLREIPRLLVDGKLDEARARAGLLARPPTDPGLRPWSIESIRAVDAAHQLAAAPDLAEACRRTSRVALACGECHVRARLASAIALPPVPSGSHHGWIADRLLDGIVADSRLAWRAGLDGLAREPRLAELGRGAIADLEAQRDSLDDRARAYREILRACVACHQHGTPHAPTRR